MASAVCSFGHAAGQWIAPLLDQVRWQCVAGGLQAQPYFQNITPVSTMAQASTAWRTACCGMRRMMKTAL